MRVHSRRSWPVRSIVGMLAFGAFVLSLAVHHQWFPLLSTDNDEAVYLFQAQLFRAGRATLPAALTARGFQPWMSGPVGHRLIMVFPPGWPAVLALGTALFGSPAVVVAIVAAAVAVGAYAFVVELLDDRRVALIAAIALCLSPFLVVLTGTALSYPFALALDLAAATFTLRAVRRGQPRSLFGTGVAAGLLFTARPLDAVLLTMVLGGWLLWSWRGRPSHAHIVRGAVWASVGAVVFVVASLAYNAHVTGNPWRFPLHANGGNNQFGFGLRQLSIDAPLLNVTPANMWRATRSNLAEFPHWIVGGFLALPLIAFGAATLWRRHRQQLALLTAIAVAWPVAHFFYYGTMLVATGRKNFGPFYYLPLIIPATVCVAAALARLALRNRAVAAGVAAILIGVTVPDGYAPPLRRAMANTRGAQREVALVSRARPPAVVIIPASGDGPWIMHPRGHFRNSPRLDGPILYAGDDGAADARLFDRFPHRRIYNLFGEAPAGSRPGAVRPRLVQLSRLSAPALQVDERFVNESGGSNVVAYLATVNGIHRCVLDESSSRGRSYEAVWRVSPVGVVEPDGCVSRDRFALFDTLSGGLLAGCAVGASSDFDGVNRYEELWPMRITADHVEVVEPGVERRTIEATLGRGLGVFNGLIGPTLRLSITPAS